MPSELGWAPARVLNGHSAKECGRGVQGSLFQGASEGPLAR